MSEKDTLKEWSEKMSTLQKILITMGAIIISIFGGLQWISKEIQKHDEKVLTANADIFADRVLEILQSEGIATRGDLISATDSVMEEIEVNRITNDSLHIRSFRAQDQIILDVNEAKYSDSTVQKRMGALEKALSEILGITTTSMEEQSAQAFTDSLQNELLMIKQQHNRTNLMRQLEQQHRDEMNRIRDLSRDIVIDKGRKKTVRAKTKTPTWQKKSTIH
jgi:hypothetical protein